MKKRYLLVKVLYDLVVGVFEPLPLEYLSAVIKQQGRYAFIHDEALHSPLFRYSRLVKIIEQNEINYICFSAMCNKMQVVIEFAEKLKRKFPNLKIAIGGAEVELNYKDFLLPAFDYVYYDYGLSSFSEAVKNDFAENMLHLSTGMAYQKNGKWIENERSAPVCGFVTRPDRSHFYKHKSKYKLAAKGSFALMKTSFSCPGKCNFCASRLLNGAVYTERPVDDVVGEISEIACDRVFILDDDFLVNTERVKKICGKLIENGIKKTFMVYARADSIVKSEKILPLLYTAGFRDYLVGVEALKDEYLKQFEKNSTVAINEQCLELLVRHGMLCNPLFVISEQFTSRDFGDIRRFIRKRRLIWSFYSYMIPLKGTKLHEEYKEQITNYGYKRTSGQAMLVKPTKLPKFWFWIRLWLLYILGFPVIYLAGARHEYDQYLNR